MEDMRGRLETPLLSGTEAVERDATGLGRAGRKLLRRIIDEMEYTIYPRIKSVHLAKVQYWYQQNITNEFSKL